MGIFDKVRDVAASAVGSTIHSTKENAKLVGIRSELSSLNDDLKANGTPARKKNPADLTTGE